MRLRRILWRAGCRYRKNVAELPGRPDIVFTRARLAIFCDGDFWHGKAWEERRAKLAEGTNPDYWIAKIERNMERDVRSNELLEKGGWTVLRFWESQIQNDPEAVAARVLEVLDARGHRRALTIRRKQSVN
jgi:DNA mismatch endonuclease (patch repair protein)